MEQRRLTCSGNYGHVTRTLKRVGGGGNSDHIGQIGQTECKVFITSVSGNIA